MSKVRQLVVVAVVAALIAGPAQAEGSCGPPGASFTRREPADLGFDPALLQEALDFATAHTSFTALVVRSGCLVGETRLDGVIGSQRFDGWSMTKSVTSMVVGRAVTLGLLDIDAPLGPLFPEADAAHAALTPRGLLTMTSGLHRNWVRELNPLMPDRVRDALSLPVDHAEGAVWAYAQSPVTLLAEAVTRAAGRDIVAFAQDELFGKVGISADDYTWTRDRAGHAEGWAHLEMRSHAWARLGLLMLHGGVWGSERLLDAGYVTESITPAAANQAYGLLWWLNGGGAYALPSPWGEVHGVGKMVESAPPDMFVAAGAGEQRTYVIPSLDLVVVRLGDRGSREVDNDASVWTARAGEFDNEFLRLVQRALVAVPYDDPGPYQWSEPYVPPTDRGIVAEAQEADHVLAGASVGPAAPSGCDPTGCS